MGSMLFSLRDFRRNTNGYFSPGANVIGCLFGRTMSCRANPSFRAEMIAAWLPSSLHPVERQRQVSQKLELVGS